MNKYGNKFNIDKLPIGGPCSSIKDTACPTDSLARQEFNRGIRYLDARKGAKALAIFREFLKDYPRKEVYLNIGNALRVLEREEEATAQYILAADDSVPFLDGTYGPSVIAYNNIGLQEYNAGRLSSAIDFYHAALTIDPLYGESIWNLAVAELKQSNCLKGWDKYEWRFKHGPKSAIRYTGLPTWDLESKGSSICVQAEQGLGDKIMFGRYVHLVEPYFSKVRVICHPTLDIFYAGYECVREPTGEYMIPMGSLVQKFGIVGPSSVYDRIKDIPAINVNGRTSSSNFNIAVCWSGSSGHSNSKYRNCPSGYLSNFSKYGTLFSLDPNGVAARGVTCLKPASWSETIAYIKGMQLVISVDTSIVHLAGTLGIPCIMVQPRQSSDFRWGMPGDKNVWYSSVIVVSNSGEWSETFSRVEEIVKCIKS